MSDLIALLQKLETSLWRSETRFDSHYMESILAEDFIEFGRSGKIYTRKDILNTKAIADIKATLPLPDFKVLPISENVMQVIYISITHYNGLEKANRSSIWRKDNGKWKLRFHQGTIIS